MAFLDKLGQMAGKVTEVAGDGLDYSKAKGKIVLEKGKVKDGKEALGDYVYNAIMAGEEICDEKLNELIAEIKAHVDAIAELETNAQISKAEISEGIGRKKSEPIPGEEAVETVEEVIAEAAEEE